VISNSSCHGTPEVKQILLAWRMERCPEGPSPAAEPPGVRNIDDDGEGRRCSAGRRSSSGRRSLSRSDAPADDSILSVQSRQVSMGVGIDAQLVTVHTSSSGAFVTGIKSVSAESSLLLALWPASNLIQGRQSGGRFQRSTRGSTAPQRSYSPGAPELRDAASTA
jgi:hypothetical protein